MNVFQTTFEDRLKQWHDLRDKLDIQDIQTKCVEVDKWWQHAPLVTHYLHFDDIDNWSSPWDLLAENTYCTVARALGICYTLILLGISDVKIVEARDQLGNDVVLVLVNNAKYILNYWPDMVLNNKLEDFNILKEATIKTLFDKIG